MASCRQEASMNCASLIILPFINLLSPVNISAQFKGCVFSGGTNRNALCLCCVCACFTDSREESVLGSIPLPSYVIAPVEPDDHINRKYAFKVTLKCLWISSMKVMLQSVRLCKMKCGQFIIYEVYSRTSYTTSTCTSWYTSFSFD